MQREDTKFDVAVIGGGPAGMMAAIQAAQKGLRASPERSRRVVLLEKNKQLGKKLLLTGGGRCNLTNAEFNLRKLVANYHNGEFLFHVFSIFGPKQTIEFFENLGVKTKTETGNKVFPQNDDADEILEALKKELEKNKVEIIYNSEVVDVEKKGNKITQIVLNNGVRVSANKYMLATGGKSYPLTGSNGAGYKLAEKLGHTIIKPVPALSPIILSDSWAKSLQGISLKNIRINVLLDGKKIPPSPDGFGAAKGEILFTHFGISGPDVLNISSKIGDLLGKSGLRLSLDLFPDLNKEEVLKSFEEILQKFPNKTIKNILCELAPEKFADAFLDVAKIDKTKIANNLPKTEKALIIKNLKGFEMIPEDIMGFDNAMVTKGGVSIKEINHKTMQSKIISNLYFAGEIIDVNGNTGGFNLQMCWATGYISGKNPSI